MKYSAEPALLRQPVHLLAFGFGAGLSPFAPGTAGTLIAVPLILLILQLGTVAYVLWVLIACIAGVYICGESARRLGLHDHPGIVWDEIAGYSVTMLAAPRDAFGFVAGFVLFRIFDIFKPWPIREADHSLPGGAGIMLDDIIAGIFAGAILLAVNHIW